MRFSQLHGKVAAALFGKAEPALYSAGDGLPAVPCTVLEQRDAVTDKVTNTVKGHRLVLQVQRADIGEYKHGASITYNGIIYLVTDKVYENNAVLHLVVRKT